MVVVVVPAVGAEVVKMDRLRETETGRSGRRDELINVLLFNFVTHDISAISRHAMIFGGLLSSSA